MKKQDKPNRFALTLLFSAIVFITMFITMIIVAVIFMILIRLGVFTTVDFVPSADNIILLIALTSVIIGTGLSLITSKIPLKPTNRIINGMNRLAQGDFSARIDLGNLAVGKEVADSFNTMASELEKTENLRAEFINNFSHEFKTPIVSIAGFAKLLRKGNLNEEQKSEYLAVIEEESLRLAHIATNILNLTKVENQEILTDVTKFNLSEQLRTCILMLEEKWSAKNLDIVINFDEYDISANEDLLKQVWINLIDNAVKFTPENGMIELTVMRVADELEVRIFNSDSFIAEESTDKIFNKFYQTDESHSSQGNGIGLAIAKKITELHKGKIEVESDEEGTYFTVSLPV